MDKIIAMFAVQLTLKPLSTAKNISFGSHSVSRFICSGRVVRADGSLKFAMVSTVTETVINIILD